MWKMQNLAIIFLCCSLIVNASRNFETSPKYAQVPQDTEAEVGERVILRCRSTNYEEKVQWTKGGFGMGYRDEIHRFDPRYSMRGDDGHTWDLEIHEVTMQDDDEYDCQIHGSKSPPAKLTVFQAPDPPYIEGGEVKKVIEGQEVEISCFAKEGKPAAEIHWRDQNKRLISNVRYKSKRMKDSKLFQASSSMTLVPTKEMHNTTFTCESWNRASRGPSMTKVRLEVLFSPSVTITPVKPGMAREGEKVGYRCSAIANPPPQPNKYKWYIDDQLIPGQFGYYYEIFNISRRYQDRQIKCSVENDLGIAKGVRTIEVQYGPTFITQPSDVSNHEMESVTLYCEVESNPTPKYYWTKGDSRKIIQTNQNLNLILSRETEGVYFCHASASDFPTVTSHPAQVMLKAPPSIGSPTSQFGEIGTDVQVNCVAHAVPEPTQTLWKFHSKYLEEGNPHYRIVNTPIQNGLRSTLIIRQSISSDFGTYTCHVKNDLGQADLHIELEQRRPFPIMPTVVGVFTCVIIVLVTAIFIIVIRRKKSEMQQRKGKNFVNTANNLIAANTMNQEFIKHPNNMKNDNDSNEADSAWEGSDGDNVPESGIIYGRIGDTNGGLTQKLLKESEPDFPPKPDVISTGYIPFGTYVRDFNPPLNGMSVDTSVSSLYGTVTNRSMLNVADPRYSATYGNPYLKQVGPSTMQYSTFLPPASSTSTISTFQHLPNINSNNNHCNTLPNTNGSAISGESRPPSVTPLQNGGITSSTPNSSVMNMACLPEEKLEEKCARMATIGASSSPSNMKSLPEGSVEDQYAKIIPKRAQNGVQNPTNSGASNNNNLNSNNYMIGSSANPNIAIRLSTGGGLATHV